MSSVDCWSARRNSASSEAREAVEHVVVASLADLPGKELPPMDIVLHLAGVLRPQTLSGYDEMNVRGTEALLECLKAQSWEPSMLVHLSSTAARDYQQGLRYVPFGGTDASKAVRTRAVRILLVNDLEDVAGLE